MIAKLLVSGAIVFAACLGLAAPANADPSVFNVLSCSCPEVTPADSPVRADKMNQGIQQGLSGVPSSAPVQ